ncbi:MAG: hypothetical protein HC874_26185, partial [Richelia sp. SL_2_1]|nr:hypothetical protein [Richelia sp. SL_2_1]
MSYQELIDYILEFAKDNPDVLNQPVSIFVTHEDEVYASNSLFITSETCEHYTGSSGLGGLDIGYLVIETGLDQHIL